MTINTLLDSIFDGLTPLGTMTPIGTVLCFMIATALILMGAYSMISVATTLTPRAIYVGIAFLTFDVIVFYMVYEVCKAAFVEEHASTELGYWFSNMIPHYRWFLMCALLAAGIVRLIWVQRTMSTTINQFSVGTTLDLIPLGVAFSNDYGQVMQANDKIDELCYHLTGSALSNENEFWKAVTTGNIKNGTLISRPDLTGELRGDISDGELITEKPVIRMPDGSIWMFSKTEIQTDIGPVSQLIAIDATKEEGLVQELNQSNKQLRAMNQRLRRYHEEVDDTVRSEELLQAKMRVHDKMGETLLAAKIYLTNEESPVDAETVLNSWEQDLALLREESRGDEQPKQMERFVDAAKHLGIDLQIIGEIPQNREILNLICVGIQECMTNAFQHSGADQMYVTIIKDDFAYTVDYSDNGKTPTYPIKEGGGLGMLREMAEKMEATMNYGDGRHFRLTLEIPRTYVEI